VNFTKNYTLLCLYLYRFSGDFQFVIFTVGYWPSYNVPFYPVIYNLSGILEQVDTHGWRFMSYQVSARANIFRRDQSKVVDIKSTQEFSIYNGTYLGQALSDLAKSSFSDTRHRAVLISATADHAASC